MGFNQRLLMLNNLKEAEISALNNLLDSNKVLSEEERKQLATLREKIIEYDNAINELCASVKRHSSFSEAELRRNLCSLMSIYEGKNYIYQDTYYCTVDEQQEFIRKHPRLIIDKDDSSDPYSDSLGSSLSKLQAEGKALVLADDKPSYSTGISFYRINKGNNALDSIITNQQFSYVKDFIDLLIDYKITNDTETIPYDTFEELKREFILSSVEEIKDNYSARQAEDGEELKRKAAAREKALTSIVNSGQ